MRAIDDGLGCGHVEAARGDNRNNRPTVTRNATDLRRARQRARAVVGRIQSEVIAFLNERGIQLLADDNPQQINEAITRLATNRLREELLPWLEDRRLQTMSRAVRAAFDLMQKALPGVVTDDEFPGTPTISLRDRSLNREMTNIDAGILYQNDDSVARSVGNRVTRELQQGFAVGETGSTLAERVRAVLAGSEREDTGVTGMTTQSEAEMIAHDSVQDAYITTAHRRYLNNGFRYAVYDATIDTRTSALCRRFDERVIDLVEHPQLVPPNHPHCRSGIRPILSLGDRAVLQPGNVADSYLNTIYRNAGYRPTVMNTDDEFRPTALTQQLAQTQS